MSILNRFRCSFAGTIDWYYDNFRVNLAKFDWLLQKVLMSLVWYLIDYY